MSGIPLHMSRQNYQELRDEHHEDQIAGITAPQASKAKQYDPLPEQADVWEQQYDTERPKQFAKSFPYSNQDIHHSHPQIEAQETQLWTPIWLYKTTLALFAVVSILLLLATLLLYHFSNLNSGLAVQAEANHYAWKYGPTAFLAIMAALWQQVQYSTMILTPWKQLQLGPVSADKSLLLDYVSPLIPVSLMNSIRNRHWAVLASILGSLCIMATTVFSTGLLVLEPIAVTRPAGFAVKSLLKADEGDKAPSRATVGPAAVQIYYGVNFQGLRYPSNVGDDFVLPEVKVIGDSRAMNITNFQTQVGGAQMHYDCEILPPLKISETKMPWRNMNQEIQPKVFVSDIQTSNCSIKGVPFAEGPLKNVYHNANVSQNYQAQFMYYPCNNGIDYAKFINRTDQTTLAKIFNSSADIRLLMSVTDLRYTPTPKATEPKDLRVANITAALCKPSFTLESFNIEAPNRFNGSANATTTTTTTGKQQTNKVPGFTNGDLAMAVWSSAANWNMGDGGEDFVLTKEVPTLFQLMQLKNGNTTLKAFMDPDTLIKIGSTVVKGVAAQTFAQLAVNPGDGGTTRGILMAIESKLVVKALSVGFMCALLALLAVISIIMIFIRPKSAIPTEPGSVGAMATIMASSPELQEALKGMDIPDVSHLEENLSSYRYRSALVPGPTLGFAVRVSKKNHYEDIRAGLVTELTKPSLQWWRPAASRTWYFIFVVWLPLTMIIGLEIAQQASDRKVGFLRLRENDSPVFANYIPAVIMVITAAMYSSMERMTATFAPFMALKRGNSGSSNSIRLHLAGDLLPVALFKSVKTRNFAVSVALVGKLIALFLTIVVSGLYSTVTVPVKHSVVIEPSDVFGFENTQLALQDNTASQVFSLVEYLGLNSTKWIHKDLVFNKFKFDGLESLDNSSSAKLQATVPAIRPVLTCKAIPNTNWKMGRVANAIVVPGSDTPFENNESELGKNFLQVDLRTNLTFSDWCERPPNKTAKFKEWSQQLLVPKNEDWTFFGRASVMLWYQSYVYSGIVTPSAILGPDLTFGAVDNGCPSLAFTFGRFKVTSLQTSGNGTQWSLGRDFGTILCWHGLEEVMTNVTWTVPGFEIHRNEPPIPNESTVKRLKSARGSERFPFITNSWLNGITDPNGIHLALDGTNGTAIGNNKLDIFMKAFVRSKDSPPMDQMAGDTHTDTLIKAMQQFYKRYMVQAISHNMRTNKKISKRDKDKPDKAILTTVDEKRLQQNWASKIALQVMLGAMVVCAVATRLLMGVPRRVLPHNPWSIAGMAALLAGSRLASRHVIPPGSEWKSSEALRQMGVFEQGTFTLKWWGDDVDTERYGVDLDVDELEMKKYSY